MTLSVVEDLHKPSLMEVAGGIALLPVAMILVVYWAIRETW